MKRLVFCVLSLLFTTTAVARAGVVTAPIVESTLSASDPVVYVWPSQDEVDVLVRDRIVGGIESEVCLEWAGLAYDVGWPVEQIPKLLRIIHRESRCLPDACSESDSGRVCRDWGLTQINDHSWKTTIRGQGMEMRDMWNPELNLRFALWLYNYSEDRNGDGWQPWRMQH
jgi:hypothetical protein